MGNICRKQKYLWLIAIYVVSQAMLLFISGQWWDDWSFGLKGTEDEGLRMLVETGRPTYAFYVNLVKDIPNWGYRIIVVILFLFVALLFYEILRKTKIFSEEDSFFVAAVAMTIPGNDARATLICFPYAVDLTLFMVGFFLLMRMNESSGRKRLVYRVSSLILLSISYFMQSLLVFTAVLWLYLFYCVWKNNKGLNLSGIIVLFLKNNWDYLSLPFAFFFVKSVFFKPFGRYVAYNIVTLKHLVLGTCVSPYSIILTGLDIIRSYLLEIGLFTVIVIAIISVIYVRLYRKYNGYVENSEGECKDFRYIALLGFCIYYFGMYAYIIIRRGLPLFSVGVESRDTILVGFGLGILALAIVRLLPFKHSYQNAILIALIVLGIFHFNNAYLNYQEDWYQQQEFMTILEENEGFIEDDTILCHFSNDSPIMGTRFYTLNAISCVVTEKKDNFFFVGIDDLQHLAQIDFFVQGGYHCDEYDSSDSSIDGLLFLENEPISNEELIRMRFYEITDKEKFQKEIQDKIDYKYIKISREMSEKIINLYNAGELDKEELKVIADKSEG